MKFQLKDPSSRHLNGSGWVGCVSGLLAIVFKKDRAWADRLILRRRRRLNYRGVMQQFLEDDDENEVWSADWRELVAILRKVQPHIRSRTTATPQLLEDFAQKRARRTDVAYVVMVYEHVMLIIDGKVLDCFSDDPEDMDSCLWKNKQVLDYVVLKKK